jgi:transcriptional regulator GlxA family with amidase domain
MSDKRHPRPKRIGLLLFDGITALDVAGPMEAFASARISSDPRSATPCYELFTIGLTNDLCLALIEEDYGRSAALTVARDLLVFMKRPGGQEQYSEPLRFQFQSTDSTTVVAAHIQSHLSQDLSVNALASLAHLSYRQFSRRFKAAFHCSPAAYVEAVRLDESRTRLCETRCNIDQLAGSVGFASDDAFRTAFERRFGVSPSQYRVRFGAQPQ